MKKEEIKSDDTIREEAQVKKLTKCLKKILKILRICKKKKKTKGRDKLNDDCSNI